jgi:zinc/manganese transport system permease protein
MLAGIMIYDLLITPFADYAFMRRALVACLALALGGAPLGVFLTLRRMTLMGDAISHAILPGASLAFLIYGLSLWPMALGGMIAALLVAMLAGLVARYTQLKEDASFTGAYLLSLAIGVLLISIKGSSIDVMHVLFGNVLAVDHQSLLMIAGITSFSTLLLAALYRSLIVECFDSGFLQAVRGHSGWIQQIFLALVVLNLVAAFQTLGTLMALGIMVLPAIAARFWTRNMDHTILLSVLLAIGAAYVGLLLSYHYNLPSGPAIVLTAGWLYIISVLFGRYGSFMARIKPLHHFTS